ncbi:major facilitator superfamily domain-containing protein [Polychytrium aggregatum]|uniref:major facilitator superfamily domain-containing protein n=1 Tax=Polychytrium aggregatum TaxID=110093 RepID=UPI0022FE806A|nr:major facilitator superfamily domain-containing protein [Polychytrium aggregatum]KAI9205319.1 major facilitator superfamily domain-containing protein [Polychytrium aggregatum]
MASTFSDRFRSSSFNGFPMMQCILLLTNVLPEVLIHHMLVPLYPFMARTLISPTSQGIVMAGDKPAYAYYAGLLQSAYFFPTIFMTIVWGTASDKVGRKPILLLGLVGYCTGTLCLGLSTQYWLAALGLSISGAFAANTVVAKGMIGELASDDQSRAWGYSMYGVVFGAAGIVGSLLGGLLGDKALFQGVQFLEERPYFVACALGAVLALIGIALDIQFLREAHDSSHSYQGLTGQDFGEELDPLDESFIMEPVASSGSKLPHDHLVGDDEGDDDDSSSSDVVRGKFKPSVHGATAVPAFLRPMVQFFRSCWRLLSIRTIMPMLLYSIYALSNSIYGTSLPLLASASHEAGGFGMGTGETGAAVMTTSIAKLGAKILFYPVQRRFGTVWTYRIGCLLIIPAVLLPPIFGQISTWPALIAAACFIGVGEGWLYISVVMMITDSVKVKHLGLIHGLAGCMASVVRTIGPAVSGLVWQVGSDLHSPWLVFAMASLSATSGFLATFYMPSREGPSGYAI